MGVCTPWTRCQFITGHHAAHRDTQMGTDTNTHTYREAGTHTYRGTHIHGYRAKHLYLRGNGVNMHVSER